MTSSGQEGILGNPGYQVTLDLRNRPCLVVGGGLVAEERTVRLLEAFARVTIVSPDLTRNLERMQGDGRIAVHRRRFKEEDLEGIHLVMNTVASDRAMSGRLMDCSLEKRFLLNAHDQPEFSNFLMPALVRQGALRIAISTSGEGPGVSQRIRKGMESVFNGKFAEYLAWAAEQRRKVFAEEEDSKQRTNRIRRTTVGLRIEGRVHYPKAWDTE